MTFTWRRKHWILFALLLISQVLGVWAFAARNGLSDGFVKIPFLLLPTWVLGSAFLTTIIVIEFFEKAFPPGKTSALRLVIFWIICAVGGVLVWRLIR